MSLAFLPPKFPRFFAAVYGLVERIVRRLGPAIRGSHLERPFTAVERWTKAVLFDCRMCGDCVLPATGMVCPMRCPKGMRNGPCGGVRADGGCEVAPSRRCVWTEAWHGLKVQERSREFAVVHPARRHDWQGRSAWLHTTPPEEDAATSSPAEAVLRDPASPLEGLLRRGVFAVTAEMTPPDVIVRDEFRQRLAHYRGCVDAVNVPDGPGANCHLSSLAAAALLIGEGLQPVMQLCCRDRNVIALQADILGAAALGVRNLLCLTGDGIGQGDHAWARPVFELDSATLLQTATMISAQGRLRSGRVLAEAPPLFVGATISPLAEPLEARALNLARKVAAGARFVQTQYCFDVPRFEAFMREVRDLGLHERCHILVGLGFLSSARAAAWIQRHVAGANIPDSLIRRLEHSSDPAKTGMDICLELLDQVRAIPGVAGVHLMMHRQAHRLSELVERSGLLAGRQAGAWGEAVPGRRTAGTGVARSAQCSDS